MEKFRVLRQHWLIGHFKKNYNQEYEYRERMSEVPIRIYAQLNRGRIGINIYDENYKNVIVFYGLTV